LCYLSELSGWISQIDAWIATVAVILFVPTGTYLLVSGLDDFALDCLWLWRCLRGGRSAAAAPKEQKRIAVLVPLWRESGVIGRMLEHNLAAIDYERYEIFAGCYQNDEATAAEVRAVAERHDRVHLAVVPHDGPTSKADCLNWICQEMCVWEEENCRQAEVAVVHDAEDLIHPLSFRAINQHTEEAGMVQVPVLPLATPWWDLTHGVYCDDFAESQGKDLESRVGIGGFLPGCGVGTALRRDALDALAVADANRIFQPDALTEDYDLGIRLHQLGFRQKFAPLEWHRGAPVATREYFPQRLDSAVRQRTRWVTGNALQSWERHGWGHGMRRPWVQAWFLWRDRKGLWGNAISLLCNVLFIWGVASWAVAEAAGRQWPLASRLAGQFPLQWVLGLNLALFGERMVVRALATSAVYGWGFAAGSPFRMFWGNWINARAAFGAVRQWGAAKLKGEPLRWLKTEHAYPNRAALRAHKRLLGEVLVANGWCTEAEIQAALEAKAPGELLGEYLVSRGQVSEEGLYAAISIQESLPQAEFELRAVKPRVARLLPEEVADRWRVLPFRVAGGVLDIASPCVPDEAMHQAIGSYTSLRLRFHLLAPVRYEGIRRQVR
jgi:adsorption protein B